MAYKGITNIQSQPNVQAVIKPKRLNFLASICVCLLVFSVLNISLFNLFNLSTFVKRVTLNWTPKPEDMGKIKFVNFSFNNNGEKGNGVFIVASPFKSYYASNISPTLLQVNGLGDPIVLSPIDGKVLAVEILEGKCNISISSGNVIVNLLGVTNACASVGDNVQVGQKIAISLDSNICFSIICDGEYINLPASGLEDTFFE